MSKANIFVMIKTSWTPLDDVFWIRMPKVNIIVSVKTFWRCLEDVFGKARWKTSSRCLQDECLLAPLMPFSPINSILISVERSNFNFVIFKAARHASLGAVYCSNSNISSQDIYFKSSQIHLLTIMYCFEHINHDKWFLMNFLF